MCSKFTWKHPCRSVFIEITLRHGCSPVHLLHIFRTIFYENTSRGLLLTMAYDRLFSEQLNSISRWLLPQYYFWRQVTVSWNISIKCFWILFSLFLFSFTFLVFLMKLIITALFARSLNWIIQQHIFTACTSVLIMCFFINCGCEFTNQHQVFFFNNLQPTFT